MTSHAGPAGYQPGDRVILVATTDPYTLLKPGTRGTVTGRDDRHSQFSDCSAPFDASELRFYVEDMPVTLSGRRVWLKFLVTSIGP